MNDKMTEILLLQWAEHHPYLFTIIKIASPTIYVILFLVAIKLIGWVGSRR